MNVLLISCYDLGHQPFSIASAAAHLLERGHRVECLDLAVQTFDRGKILNSDVIGISVPMHTAMCLGIKVAKRAKAIKPESYLCYFGLYASLNEQKLLSNLGDTVIGGEFEGPLADYIDGLETGEMVTSGVSRPHVSGRPNLSRQEFITPVRSLLPPLEDYSKLTVSGQGEKLVGSTQTSRGCAHRCRHCPIPSAYEGRLRLVQEQVVLADIDNLVKMGAEHISFGDPDFLNGVKYSLKIVRAMYQKHSNISFDITAKIEHLLEYPEVLCELGSLGCLFVVSAVETVDDRILEYLDKGHTRDDVVVALQHTRNAGIYLKPSLLPFTPWTTMSGYLDLLAFIEEHDLIYHVDPVHYSIRLLLPPGSKLLEISELSNLVGELSNEDLVYEWEHPDGRVDALQKQIACMVESSVVDGEDWAIIFAKVKALALGKEAGYLEAFSNDLFLPVELRPPVFSESWFC
ncbi:MAG TPA: radical SAM protein [Gemmatimonadetes bacterium]|nr:radical SAM protein [Gemmatimonadota bacterium]